MQSRAKYVVGLVVLVGGLGLSLLAFRLTGTGTVMPFDKPARVDGTTVEVSYGGSTCRSGAELTLEESAERVLVTVEERTRAWSCDDAGVTYELTGELEDPLGDRELVDGACLLETWAENPICQEPTLAAPDA